MVETYDTHEYDSLYTALITPFKEESYEVDFNAYRDLIRYYKENQGFRDLNGGFIVNPAAGEIHALTREERNLAVETVVDEAGDDFNVFAGVSELQYDALIEAVQETVDLGVDGIFVMPPEGPGEVRIYIDAQKYPEVWVNHTRTIAEAADVPLIIHGNKPPDDDFGPGLPIETTKRMVEEVPSIVGWKMIYNERGFDQTAKYLRYSIDKHIGILPASGSSFSGALEKGFFDGSVSGSFNYALEPMVEHLQAYNDGDREKTRRIMYDKLYHLHSYIYEESARLHLRYKIAAWLRGLTPHPFMRPPMPAPKEEEISTLYALLSEYSGVDTIDESEVRSVIEQVSENQGYMFK